MNTLFQKPVDKIFTWHHPRTGKGVILDLVPTNTQDLKIIDIRTSKEGEAGTDHCLLTAIIKIDNLQIRKNEIFWKNYYEKKWKSVYGPEEIK